MSSTDSRQVRHVPDTAFHSRLTARSFRATSFATRGTSEAEEESGPP